MIARNAVIDRAKGKPVTVGISQNIMSFAADRFWNPLDHALVRPSAGNENGLDDRTGLRRSQFLFDHFTELLKARADGVNLTTYLHWSLMDNFEWLEAWGPRFAALPCRLQDARAAAHASARLLSADRHQRPDLRRFSHRRFSFAEKRARLWPFRKS